MSIIKFIVIAFIVLVLLASIIIIFVISGIENNYPYEEEYYDKKG